VTPVQPTLTLGLTERAQYTDVTLPVPQGNRTAMLISAQRADFGGDLTIELKDLPPGVTAELLPMAANRNEIPVLLTAAPGAAPAGALVDAVGRPVDVNVKIDGHLRQKTSLVRGQNNIDVWTCTTERMAVSVAAEAPFKIEVVEPKVPLVRDGAMDLKVVATRKEGFTAPIGVRMLYNPPGVGSSGSIVIPEGQNEAVIPLTANGAAEVQKCKIVVLGEATVGDGPVLVASQMVTLTWPSSF